MRTWLLHAHIPMHTNSASTFNNPHPTSICLSRIPVSPVFGMYEGAGQNNSVHVLDIFLNPGFSCASRLCFESRFFLCFPVIINPGFYMFPGSLKMPVNDRLAVT